MQLHFQGLVTLVTGGASGLGRGTVERFVRQGAKVVIADLPTSKGAEVSKEIGSSTIFTPMDVSSALAVSEWMDIHEKN